MIIEEKSRTILEMEESRKHNSDHQPLSGCQHYMKKKETILLINLSNLGILHRCIHVVVVKITPKLSAISQQLKQC